MDLPFPVDTVKKKQRGNNSPHSSFQEALALPSKVLPLQHCPFNSKAKWVPYQPICPPVSMCSLPHIPPFAILRLDNRKKALCFRSSHYGLVS